MKIEETSFGPWARLTWQHTQHSRHGSSRVYPDKILVIYGTEQATPLRMKSTCSYAKPCHSIEWRSMSPNQARRTNFRRVINDTPKLSPEAIHDLLARTHVAGPGSHTIVGVDRDGAAGHWFNSYFDGNRFTQSMGRPGKS
jgi:hypothetical protein